MSTLHAIRLRGPWDYVPLAAFVERDVGDVSDIGDAGALVESTVDLPPAGRMAMPADWGESLGCAFRGRVAYRRRFGQPTGVESAERVWLVCDGAEAWATLTVNGERLGDVNGPASRSEFDVTALLRERNELTATVECPRRTADGRFADRGERSALPGGLVGEVRLEIRGDNSAVSNGSETA